MKTCLVIGKPIGHSLSPLIHNAGYRALGIQDQFCFKAQEPNEVELSEVIKLLRAGTVTGISVTLPYKTAVIPFLDQISNEARLIKAVNTVIMKDGQIFGLNTDCYGIERSITEFVKELPKTALIVGAGGAARSAIVSLQKLGASVFVMNRTIAKAQSLADEFSATFISEQAACNKSFSMLVNTTPVGMFPNTKNLAVNTNIIQNTNCIFDTIYNPLETLLIQEAKKLGKQTIYGSKMFLYQALQQFELYTGHQAPVDAMESSLMEHFKNEK